MSVPPAGHVFTHLLVASFVGRIKQNLLALDRLNLRVLQNKCGKCKNVCIFQVRREISLFFSAHVFVDVRVQPCNTFNLFHAV